MSRGLIITKTGNFYVTNERPDWADEAKDAITAHLATGGEVSVHYSNVEACEWYEDHHIETFRRRHLELQLPRGI